jgi:hypothetical protein
MTTAEHINAALTYYLNQGSPSILDREDFRKKAWFFLTKTAKRLWNSAPYWFKHSSTTVVLTSGVGTMPADFSNMGTEGQLYVSTERHHMLTYKPPDFIHYQIQNIPQAGQPWAYCFEGNSATGVPKILCYPTDSSTLALTDYVRLCPELIDAPPAPTPVATADAGNPNGVYTYAMTYVTASGETEGGQISGTVSVDHLQVTVTLPLSWNRTVTSRKLYRTAASGVQHKLLATIGDNLTTSYTDNALDASLGANIPTPATAFSGVEVFPTDFHESSLIDGLVFYLGTSQDDGRTAAFFQIWDQAVRRMWEEIQPGRNQVAAFPAFPGLLRGRSVWSRWSPPS